MGNVCTSRRQQLPFEPLKPGPENSAIAVSEAEAKCRKASFQREENLGIALEPEQPASHLQPENSDLPPEDLSDQPITPPPLYRAKRRCSVSAEVAALAAQSFEHQQLQRKDLETERLVKQAMTHSFLLAGLEEEQKIDCISSMSCQDVKAGDTLIRQGDEGDNFYVIGEGTFTASISQSGEEAKVVCTYHGRGAFGELALMYNCPRAATVQAVTDGCVWVMDRASFRRIILAARIARREHFEETLQGMSLFASLSPGQLASIADCLELEIIEEGVYILTEGEDLNESSKFYILEEGKISCYRNIMGEKRLVKQISNGGFFGEVALVTKASTRVADCIAMSRCKVLAMGRDAFERLMGPAQDVLKREIAEYERLNAALLGNNL